MGEAGWLCNATTVDSLKTVEKRDLLTPDNSERNEVPFGPELKVPSAASIINNVGRGIGALSMGAIIATAGQLALVPVAMRFWGPVRWGEWTVLTALVSVLALTDLGLQTFVVNRLCAEHARDERKQFMRTLHSALVVDLPLATLVLLILALALLFVPIKEVLALKTVSGFEAGTLILFLAFEVLLGVPMGVIAGLYRATGRLARGAMLANVRQAALSVLTLVLIWDGAHFVSLGIARAAVAVAISFWIIGDLSHLYPWLELRPRLGQWREGLGMIVPGLFFLSIPIASYLGNEFIFAIIQRALGGAAVSRYSTQSSALNFSKMLSNLVTIAAWPELTMLHARAEIGRLSQAHRTLSKWNFFLVCAAVCGIVAFLPLFYNIWTLRRLTLDSWTIGFLAVRVVLWGMRSGSMTVLLAINRQRAVALIECGASAAACMLAVILVPLMGIRGAAFALLIGDLCFPAWLVPLLACREVVGDITDFICEACIPPLLIVLGVALSAIWFWFSPQELIVRYTLATVFDLGLASTAVWWSLTPFERSVAVGFIQARMGSVVE